MELREYQKKDIEFMIERKRVLNANDPGLGKTLETLEAVKGLPPGDTLIVTIKKAVGVWREEAKKWYDLPIGEFVRKRNKLPKLKQMLQDYNVVATNFAQAEKILNTKNRWNTIIIDEAHLGGLLNSKSKTFKIMAQFKSRNLFILTATPVRSGLQDLYGPLHLLYPKRFPNYWQFVSKYCKVVHNGYGKDILKRPKDPVRFKQMLDYFCIRRRKDDEGILEDLPAKTRQAWPIEMTQRQAEVYTEFEEDMFITDDEGNLRLTPSPMQLHLRLRQLLVCPKLLGINSYGAALETLTQYLIPQQFDAGNSVVIATPFRQAIPFIKEALIEYTKNVYIVEVHGQMKEAAVDVVTKFQEYRDHRKVLIYTIQSGASWTAHSANVGFMLGSSESVTDNIQAEDRLHRIGQVKPVHWYYLFHEDTVDEAVKLNLNTKQSTINLIFTPERLLESIKKRRQNSR